MFFSFHFFQLWTEERMVKIRAEYFGMEVIVMLGHDLVLTSLDYLQSLHGL